MAPVTAVANQVPQPTIPTDTSAPWPYFAEEEIAAATAVLRSGKVNYWTGEEGRHFEREFAMFAGCRYAVAVANGTVALELALRAVGIGSGDEVIVPSRTYFATASCVVAVGARPVFAEIDRDSQNLTAETIRGAMTPRTRAVIAVHLAGWPADMDSILKLAKEFGLKIVEDCAQAHGATYKGKPVGCFGDVAAFSFCQDKIMTTAGEGGMVTTNSEELWASMWSYKDHGKSYRRIYEELHEPGFRWLIDSWGTNWRLSEVQSAVGRAQLRKLPEWLLTRRSHAALFTERLSRLPGLRIPNEPTYIEHAFYRFYAFVNPDRLISGWDRDRILHALTENGVSCAVGSCSEVYLEDAVPPEWRPPQRFPLARELGETSLTFLVHPTLTQPQINSACDRIECVINLACGAAQ